MALTHAEAIETVENEQFAIQERMRLCAEVAALPEQMGTIVLRHYRDEQKIADIAAELQLSVDACQRIAWDGLRYLRDIMYGEVVIPA